MCVCVGGDVTGVRVRVCGYVGVFGEYICGQFLRCETLNESMESGLRVF